MADLTPAQRLSAYMTASTQVRERVMTFADLLWGSMDSYRDADINRLVDAIVPRVQAGQIAIANLTAAYVADAAGAAGVPVIIAEVTDGRGVDPNVVYRRPAVTVYSELAAGAQFADAVKAGGLRLTQLIGMDMQMSKVRQFRTSGTAAGFDGFRRTLTGRENCAMCVIASTQRYHIGNLMPIHPGCDCGVTPLKRGEGVSQVIDEALLESTHDHVADFAGVANRGGRAPDYRQLIITQDHGEYGPTLAWRGDAFTGPDDL
ncbi:hypothetical protein [Paenarthrobacter nitroguajacolicus]|uniref:hypothetical protein n=1 Tax=Paenarthrobacter nitroguajacolicus TaxID=211146 RepID=UPI00248B9936|nr:hypothetical protein [Paenarthrobacter nitroguajacolicus]MDI2032989.1 hypothetical protein [Paenarthrobacter nitroguajacolicus]